MTDIEALATTKAFFEEMFGCVVGCGCWSRDWDNEAAIASYMASANASPDPLEALAAMTQVLDHADALYGQPAREQLELSFHDADGLRGFFARARARLEAAILAV